MITEVFLENLIEKIHNQNTKKYFDEVIKSYYLDNLRSTIVVLYSVVISDLVYKLQELKDIYNDESARDILKSIEETQIRQPTSPDWENHLVKQIKDKTNLLDVADYENIMSLQKHRHLCSHPILTQNDLLFTPNKETAKAHIRNMLEGVLIKPPILAKKIIEEFINDLAKLGDLFFNKIEDLERYLESKYLNNLNPEIENKIFRTLWKFVFKLINEDCDKNRRVNYMALKILFSRRPSELKQLIKEEKSFYSDIEIGGPMKYLFDFLCDHKPVYELLNGSAKTIIKNSVSQSSDLLLKSWFLHASFKDYLESLKKSISSNPFIKIEPNTYKKISHIAKDSGYLEEFLNLGIFVFSQSPTFDSSNSYFTNLIEPYIQDFSKSNILTLLEAINENNQNYGRGRACIDNLLVKNRSDIVLGSDFDYSTYNHFIDSLDPDQ